MKIILEVGARVIKNALVLIRGATFPFPPGAPGGGKAHHPHKTGEIPHFEPHEYTLHTNSSFRVEEGALGDGTHIVGGMYANATNY